MVCFAGEVSENTAKNVQSPHFFETTKPLERPSSAPFDIDPRQKTKATEMDIFKPKQVKKISSFFQISPPNFELIANANLKVYIRCSSIYEFSFETSNADFQLNIEKMAILEVLVRTRSVLFSFVC